MWGRLHVVVLLRAVAVCAVAITVPEPIQAVVAAERVVGAVVALDVVVVQLVVDAVDEDAVVLKRVRAMVIVEVRALPYLQEGAKHGVAVFGELALEEAADEDIFAGAAVEDVLAIAADQDTAATACGGESVAVAEAEEDVV